MLKNFRLTYLFWQKNFWIPICICKLEFSDIPDLPGKSKLFISTYFYNQANLLRFSKHRQETAEWNDVIKYFLTGWKTSVFANAAANMSWFFGGLANKGFEVVSVESAIAMPLVLNKIWFSESVLIKMFCPSVCMRILPSAFASKFAKSGLASVRDSKNFCVLIGSPETNWAFFKISGWIFNNWY